MNLFFFPPKALSYNLTRQTTYYETKDCLRSFASNPPNHTVMFLFLLLKL